jgi:hypothetical protein
MSVRQHAGAHLLLCLNKLKEQDINANETVFHDTEFPPSQIMKCLLESSFS